MEKVYGWDTPALTYPRTPSEREMVCRSTVGRGKGTQEAAVGYHMRGPWAIGGRLRDG